MQTPLAVRSGQTRRFCARAVAVAVAATMALAGFSEVASGDPGVAQELAKVRQATARYHDVARAVADGYAQGSPCVPGMGLHYVQSIANDQSELDAMAPNILVYAPRRDGSLRLVAVEYGSWEAAALFGEPFNPPGGGGPPFHTLHAWVWQANPAGMFAAFNANIECPE